MLNITQEEFVLNQLKEKGFISRNECLRNYISRLGAIICKLRKEKHEFVTKYINGDYIYTIVEEPVLMDYTRDMQSVELDKLLNKCLEQTKISWNNSERLESIKKALKSKNNIYKRNIICLYGGKPERMPMI